MRLQRLECEAFNKNELTTWPQDSTPDCEGCALNQSTWPVKAKFLLGLLWAPAEGDFSPEKCRLFYLIHLEWVLLLIHLVKSFLFAMHHPGGSTSSYFAWGLSLADCCTVWYYF